MPRDHLKKDSDELLVDLYKVASRLPNVDMVGRWIADLQGANSAYAKAVAREKRRAKRGSNGAKGVIAGVVGG